jgi:hypothetical protein
MLFRYTHPKPEEIAAKLSVPVTMTHVAQQRDEDDAAYSGV